MSTTSMLLLVWVGLVFIVMGCLGGFCTAWWLERVRRYWEQPVNNPLMTESKLEAARKWPKDPVYVIKLKWMGRLFVFVGLAVWVVTLGVWTS